MKPKYPVLIILPSISLNCWAPKPAWLTQSHAGRPWLSFRVIFDTRLTNKLELSCKTSYREDIEKLCLNNEKYQAEKGSVCCKKHMQHIWLLFVAIQQGQNMHTYEKHQRKQQQPKVLGWSQPDFCHCSCFYGRLHASTLGSSMPSDSLQVWGAKAPHLSVPHLSHPSPPCCLQLHRRHHYRAGWGVNIAPQKTERVKRTIFFAYFPRHLHLILYLTPG